MVRCPTCADDFPWPDDPTIALYDEVNDAYEMVDVSPMPPGKRADLARHGYRQCPNPSADTPRHYLPATYADYQEPLVIGLVGAPASGKTHLLTAMIRQAYRDGLRAHRVSVAALDFRRHADFRHRFVEPFEQGGQLAGTDAGIVEAADILLLRGPGGERPVTFFDVAGEDFESTAARNRATRFLIGASAVIFVCPSEDPQDGGRPAAPSENRSFDLAVERLRNRPDSANPLPVAIAVTKSDRLRYVPPAERWLRQHDDQPLNATRIKDESRDVYAYLHHIGAHAALRPFDAFPRCTLHFVSASGTDAVPVDPDAEVPEMYFPRGVRPTRVLEPLAAILAMTGVITGPEAQKVGMP